MADFNQMMLVQVDAEIERLQGIRQMLIGAAPTRVTAPVRRTARPAARRTAPARRNPARSSRPVRQPMSAADRKKRSDAQKARWSRVRAVGSATPPAPQTDSDSSKTITSNGGQPSKNLT